jgi:hypothetical protein
MPEIIEELEKFAIYTAEQQSVILGKAQTVIRNERAFSEEHLKEIERLEGLLKLKNEETPNDNSVVTNVSTPIPPVATQLEAERDFAHEEAEALLVGEVVRDMTEDEIAIAFGANQAIEEPTLEELQSVIPNTEEGGSDGVEKSPTSAGFAQVAATYQAGIVHEYVMEIKSEPPEKEKDIAAAIPDEFYKPREGAVVEVKKGQTNIPESGPQGDPTGDYDTEPGHMGEPVNEPPDGGPSEDTGRIGLTE